jgi:hypothetical protein
MMGRAYKEAVMAINLERFRKDLDRLINNGKLLEYAMRKEVAKEDFERLLKTVSEEDAETFLKRLPNFRMTYEAWYSESLALLQQLSPDRVNDFKGLYQKPKGRKSLDSGNYVIQDYLQGLSASYGGRIIADSSAALPQFMQQLAIVTAAKTRFESSLYEIRQLVQADLFDSEIDSARELLKNKFLRAAGAVAGVVLEKHLRQICADHGIKVMKKNPGVSDLNELLKAHSAIDIPQWRHISMLGDIRNLCDHDKQKEPTVHQVTDLIDGTDKVIKTIA